ncbi:Ig-like domain-containing protein, partial [bacterium]|nr:Ig-like domain-containing protein [bacterium]
MFAQDLSGIKICIDPGHGGHESDDRHIVGPEFWESEGNYSKALHAKEIITSLGGTVILTRNGNGDTGSSDPSLSQRAEIANANNADIFHSIHSNATGISTKRNMVLILYRGYDNDPVFPEAKEYARSVYRHLEKVNHVKNLSYDYIKGDWTFYPSWGTSGLGVLRPLTMPGALSEGSFHDYLPEAWRLKNDSYLRHEAWGITRALLEHYDAGTLTTGIVAGIIRDPDEGVPSSYQAMSDLGDNKKPINNIKVTLQPGNIVYNGDYQNNGFYMFDELEPGDYTLYIEADDYTPDTVDVTVTANNSVHVNKYLYPSPNPTAPNIVSNMPETESEKVSLINEIVVEFNKRMDETSVENGFSISPAMLGTFAWEKDSRIMKFKPVVALQPGTDYTVILSSDTKSHFQVNLENDYSIDFKTRSELNLIDNYPRNNEVNVSTTTDLVLTFDAPINSSTLGVNFSLKDSKGKTPNFTPDMGAYSNGQVIIRFMDTLKSDELYKLELSDGVGDIEGLTIDSSVTIQFTTIGKEVEADFIVDSLISTAWEDPTISLNSNNIDSDLTKFTFSSNKKVSGTTSGLINYNFIDESGVCCVSKSTPINLGSDLETKFGMWIYGDLSNNILEYWFYHNSSSNSIVVVDT